MANAMLTCCTGSADDMTSFGDSTGALDLNSRGDGRNRRRDKARRRHAAKTLITRIVSRRASWRAAGCQSSIARRRRHADARRACVDAAMRGDRDAVRALLKAGRRRQRGAGRRHDRAALGGAERRCRAGQAPALRAAPTCARRRGSAATRRCSSRARAASAAVIEALLAAAPTRRAPTASGATPLMLAAASGNADAVEALLEHGADVNAVGAGARRDAR